MTSNTLVSIIIPAFNEQSCIKRALKSAMTQSLREIEIIVVNDASTDKTSSIVKDLSTSEGRIKLVTHDTNKGLSHSRITGINAATGSHIMFLDADDYLQPMAAELLLQKSQETGADIVMMGTRRIVQSLRLPLPLFSPAKYFTDESMCPTMLIGALLSKRGLPLSLCDKLYSRQLLIDSQLNATTDFYGEDMLSNLRIFSIAKKFTWVDYVGYNYLTGGKSALSPTKLWIKDKELYYSCCKLLSDLKIDSSENIQALNQGALNALMSAIARQLCNPFTSRKKIEQWVYQQLNEMPELAINAVSLMSLAKQDLKRHRAFYYMSLLIG